MLRAVVFMIGLVMIAGCGSISQKSETFKNPLFLQPFADIEYKNGLVSYLLKEDGIYGISYDKTIVYNKKKCPLVVNEDSHVGYMCVNTELGGLQVLGGNQNYSIDFYSVGKDKDGYCLIKLVTYSELTEATGELMYRSTSKNCGAIENMEVKHKWHNQPEMEFTEFKNPAFNWALIPYSNQTYKMKLSLDKVTDVEKNDTHWCRLLENDEEHLLYECDIYWKGYFRMPYKQYRQYRLNCKKYSDGDIIVYVYESDEETAAEAKRTPFWATYSLKLKKCPLKNLVPKEI